VDTFGPILCVKLYHFLVLGPDRSGVDIFVVGVIAYLFLVSLSLHRAK
jgi:hypothetical protein